MREMQEVTDQIGRRVTVPLLPVRIVSLVPSQTELLFDLGLSERIRGITRFCIHPANAVRSIEKIGGTKNFDISKIQALQPDLIIGNKEENYMEGIDALSRDFPVWMSDICNLEQSLEMIGQLGQITNSAETAFAITKSINGAFETLSEARSIPLRVAYFIWRKPYMVAASGTFIDDMIHKAGFVNAFAHFSRYPEINLPQLSELQPDLIFLSSEPYAFGARHFDEFREMVPRAKVFLVNGAYFSWYGSRLLHTPAYLSELRKVVTA